MCTLPSFDHSFLVHKLLATFEWPHQVLSLQLLRRLEHRALASMDSISRGGKKVMRDNTYTRHRVWIFLGTPSYSTHAFLQVLGLSEVLARSNISRLAFDLTRVL